MIECIELSAHPFLSQCFSERFVDPAQPSERLFISQQVDNAGLLLERRWDDHQQLSTGAQPRQTRFEVVPDRVELTLRQKVVLEGGFAEGA